MTPVVVDAAAVVDLICDLPPAQAFRHRLAAAAVIAAPAYLDAEVLSALGRLNLNITSAHVATFGERAVDVFYVTDLTGTKVTQPDRQATIRRAVMAVFEADLPRGGHGRRGAQQRPAPEKSKHYPHRTHRYKPRTSILGRFLYSGAGPCVMLELVNGVMR